MFISYSRRMVCGALVASVMMAASAAQATILTIYDGIAGGVATFDATVATTKAASKTDVWSGLVGGTSIDRGDYFITQNDGAAGVIYAPYGTLSGQVMKINPVLDADVPTPPSGTRGSALNYFDSGITFTFDAPVNAIGFEVGDWATCCGAPVTELFISFDGGDPITVGTATKRADGLFPSQDPSVTRDVFEVFVGAFDDTGDFTRVSFWGNGVGERLMVGGRIKYALVDQGSLSPAPVPVPAAGLMLLSCVGAMGALRARRRR